MSVMAAALPVFVFAVNPGKAAWTVPGGGTTVMTVRLRREALLVFFSGWR
jgi:hypothetical protein